MDIKASLQRKIDTKTKPLGALGFLESIALQIGLIQQTLTPELTRPHLLIFAADHGLAQEKISAYPADVTRQMVENFLNGGAAINVFCRQHNIQLRIIDAGVKTDLSPHPELIVAKARNGSRNMLHEKAMTTDEMNFSLQHGRNIVKSIADNSCNVIGLGEMGIGNTSSATLLMAHLFNIPVEDCVGKGTGISEQQLSHKINILKQVSLKHQNISDVQDILQTFGGLEIAQMVGAVLEAKRLNMLILVDGFIASCAVAVASKMEDDVLENCIFCHESDEKAHKDLLYLLQRRAILHLNMRLGEGSGCAVAYPVIVSAVNFLNQMASFESANISGKNE